MTTSVASLHHSSPGHQAWVVKVGGKCLYPQNHLAYPEVYFYTVLRLMVFLLAKVSSAKIPLSLFCIGLLGIPSETPLEEADFSYATGY